MNLFRMSNKKSDHDYWQITLRRTTSQKTKKAIDTVFKEYAYYIEKLEKDYPQCEFGFNFEILKKSKGLNIHCHGMAKVPSGSYLFLKTKKGYSTKIAECYYRSGWEDYIRKQGLEMEGIRELAYKMLDEIKKMVPSEEYVPLQGDWQQYEDYLASVEIEYPELPDI